jgi:hypothetical protein
MNRDLTQSFTRMVCAFGHALEWRGRWRHVDERWSHLEVIDPFSGNKAEFPRTYYKVGRPAH